MSKKKIASKKKVDAGGAASKTARASMAKGKGKQEGFIAAAPEHMDRFISLAEGTYVYFLDPRNGLTYHLQVGSNTWNTMIREAFDSSHGDRIRNEIVRKGFPLPIDENPCLEMADGV